MTLTLVWFGSVWFSVIRFGLAFIYLFITLADDCQRAAAISSKLLGDVLIIVLCFLFLSVILLLYLLPSARRFMRPI